MPRLVRRSEGDATPTAERRLKRPHDPIQLGKLIVDVATAQVEYRSQEELGEGLLMDEIDSWMTDVNRNVESKQTRKIMRYSGRHPAFREQCDAVAADGYRKLALA
jgi:hypothetical protein